jgi:large subunit ribosomal protein L2
MGLRTHNPITPGVRGRVSPDFSELTQGNQPVKALTESKPSTGGRNNNGRITSRFRGGGHKRRFRKIDFKRDKIGVPATVASIEYDPNRSARIALLNYADGVKRYILSPVGLSVGDTVLSSRNADIKPGNNLPVRFIPLGTTVHSIELKIGGGAQLVRSAGVGATVMAKEGSWAQIRLPSGEVRLVHLDCRATVGQVGNVEHSSVHVGKAGRNRWKGFRGHNRGVTMNPVDHPMGGGEGRSSGGRHPCSPWGQLSKGLKTRENKRTDRMIIKRRGKKA